MSGEDRRRTRDLSRWVALNDEGRAPLVLTVMFWGTVFTDLATFGVFLAASVAGGAESADTVENFLMTAHVVVLPFTAVLWPFLSWAPRNAPRRATPVSLLFFTAATLLILTGGGAPLFVMFSVALGNVVVIWGGRSAAVGAAAATGSAPVILFAVTGDVLTGLFEAASLLFLSAMIVVVFDGLLVAHRRAEDTRALLAELEEAHAELRRYAERTRELTIAEERARMAREMHDSVGHYLTVINMGLANAERFRTAREDAAWDEVRDAKRLTQEALADTRRWVRALKPLRLEGRAGPEAMHAMVDAFSDGEGGMDADFAVEGTWPDPGEQVELVCYRVVQEGLTNAVRHSAAGHVQVRLACGEEGIRVEISDDGTGAGDRSMGDGFGLRGLRERVEGAGGALHRGDRPEGGFLIRAELPVRAGARHPALEAAP